MSSYWLAAFSLGLVSSLHCLGMCGPIALALPLNRKSAGTMLGGLVLNNGARIAGYALPGMLVGALGQGLAIAGMQSSLSIFAGAFMLLLLIISHSRFQFKGMMLGMAAGKWKAAAAKLFGRSSPYTLMLIGFINAFLPCGFVYMALAGATSTGSMTGGATFMAAFGAGTAPALISVAFAGKLVGSGLRTNLRKLTPVFVSVLACILILRGLNLGIPYISPMADKSAQYHDCCKK